MVRLAFSNVVDVSIGGAKLPPSIADALVESHVDQGAGVPAAFRLAFRDPYRQVLGRLGVTFGTPVVLTPIADGRGAGDRLLTGEVTALEVDYDGTGTFAIVRGYDAGHRLLRRRRVAAYRNQTASDIARKLAAAAGVPIGRIGATRTVYDFISQSNVSDWDFLARLADENGMVMSVDADGRFRFVAPAPSAGAPSPGTDGDKSPFVLQAGHDILRLRAAVTAADQVGRAGARGWDVTAKRQLTATAPAASNPAFGIGTTPGAAAAKFGTAALTDTGTPYDTQDEVAYAARALADDVTSAFAELEVVARGNPRLRPGVPVALSEVGRPFEGKYTVTSVRHVFGDGRHYESWVTVSGRQWRSLLGLASGGAAAEPRLPSVANALVTDVDDPLKQGRVKLRFPWLDDTYVSDWTRTVQLGGAGGGGVFPMDVGDEVLVAFDRGALDHPFVIGGLYNGRDAPTPVPDVPLHDAVRHRASRHTVSDRDGNRVDLLSQRTGARAQGVRLASGDGRLTVRLDRTRTEITVDSAGDVRISGGRSVSVEAGGDLTLSARAALTLKSGGPLTLSGNGAVNVRADGELTLNALGVLNLNAVGAAMLTGEATVQITSPVNTTIKSPVVLVNGVPLPV
jgi:phage protein D